MKDAVESILFIIAVLVVVVVLPLMMLRKMRNKRNQQLAAERAATNENYERGLRKPDYAAFEARYGCPVPPVLRQLYESSDSNLEGDFELKLESFPKPFFVAYFMGVTEENMSLVWPGMEGYFPFASDGSGNRYLVSPKEADPDVYFYDHELPKSEPLKVSLSQFLAAKRTKSRW